MGTPGHPVSGADCLLISRQAQVVDASGEPAAGRPALGKAQVSVLLSAPGGAGIVTKLATVEVVPSVRDPYPANDTSSETTDARGANIGDVVWSDADGDGIQDLGEATIPRVVVLLYSGAGDLLGFTETNQSGYYVFPYLTYGAAYRLRFVLPPSYAFTARDQWADDALDSDADPVTGETVSFSLTSFPEQLRRSLTWDQGAEMSQHARLRIDTGLRFYFCDPQSPWQRGTNENTNGLRQQYFPKGTDLSVHSATDLAAVARAQNTRLRKTLGWCTPAEALDEVLRSAR